MSREVLFDRLIEILDESRIRYALLGNTDAYPEAIGSDVDIMILPDEVGLLHASILHLGTKSGLYVAQMIQHEHVAFYYVVISLDEEGVATIQPDICTDYYRNGKRLLSASEMLHDTEIACDSLGRSKGFRVLSPENEFIYYLLKKIDKGALNEDQFAHLRDRFSKNSEGALARARQFWSEKGVWVIRQSFEQNQPSLLHEHLSLLRRELHGTLAVSIRDMIKWFFLKINRCLHPTGFVVQLYGEAEHTGVIGKEIFDLLGGAFRRHEVIDLSSPGFLNRLMLPVKIIKVRVCSTLVVLLGKRASWFIPLNAKVFKEGNGVCLVVPGKTECVVDQKSEKMFALAVSKILLDALSERTRRRCRHLNRRVKREGGVRSY